MKILVKKLLEYKTEEVEYINIQEDTAEYPYKFSINEFTSIIQSLIDSNEQSNLVLPSNIKSDLFKANTPEELTYLIKEKINETSLKDYIENQMDQFNITHHEISDFETIKIIWNYNFTEYLPYYDGNSNCLQIMSLNQILKIIDSYSDYFQLITVDELEKKDNSAFYFVNYHSELIHFIEISGDELDYLYNDNTKDMIKRELENSLEHSFTLTSIRELNYIDYLIEMIKVRELENSGGSVINRDLSFKLDFTLDELYDWELERNNDSLDYFLRIDEWDKIIKILKTGNCSENYIYKTIIALIQKEKNVNTIIKNLNILINELKEVNINSDFSDYGEYSNIFSYVLTSSNISVELIKWFISNNIKLNKEIQDVLNYNFNEYDEDIQELLRTYFNKPLKEYKMGEIEYNFSFEEYLNEIQSIKFEYYDETEDSDFEGYIFYINYKSNGNYFKDNGAYSAIWTFRELTKSKSNINLITDCNIEDDLDIEERYEKNYNLKKLIKYVNKSFLNKDTNQEYSELLQTISDKVKSNLQFKVSKKTPNID